MLLLLERDIFLSSNGRGEMDTNGKRCFICKLVHNCTVGHLTMLKWLKENGCPWNDYTILQSATTGGAADVVEYVMLS